MKLKRKLPHMSTVHSSTESTSMNRISRRSELFLCSFSNVKMRIEKTRRDDGHLGCVISVDAILGGGTLRYEIRDNGRRKKYYDPLAWIDEIEKWDALFF